MVLPDIVITDQMQAAAQKMIRSFYLQNYEPQRLTPGRASAYYDNRQALVQAAFDANPDYIAFSSIPSGRTGHSLDHKRLNEKEVGAACGVFDAALNKLISQVIDDQKSEGNLPSDFSFKRDDTYYGNGYPPRGVPVEAGFGNKWTDMVSRPSSEIELS